MKGIIWKKSSDSQAAEILFEQIIMNYEFIGINGRTIKSKDFMRFEADNGDYWEVLSGRESFRGKKCNISYIERGIPEEVVHNIILPCTVAYPFRAVTYFGDYGLEGDDYDV
jgi:hypothetical protein